MTEYQRESLRTHNDLLLLRWRTKMLSGSNNNSSDPCVALVLNALWVDTSQEVHVMFLRPLSSVTRSLLSPLRRRNTIEI